jgi:eukaryotic-like serine/threonine-protein kinase
VTVSASQEHVGQRVGQLLSGRYRVLRWIGAGGMGEVYEAENVRIGRRVALKILSGDLRKSPELVERFDREARAASAARGPHVVEMLDVGRTDDDLPFLVMELLDGTPLSRRLDGGPLAIETAVQLAVQIARGLASAHEAGVVHRDLKPDNVFLVRGDGGETAKILDFGISKIGGGDTSTELTKTGSALGTPSHMAPEQVEGKRDVDARADLWALGVLLYQMLTGKLPFEADSYGLMLVRILQEAPAPITSVRAEVPEALAAVVTRCLAKAPTDRWESAAMLETALSGWRQVPIPPSAEVTRELSPPAPPAAATSSASRDVAATPHGAAASPLLITETPRAPRDRYRFDLEEILRGVPQSASVKGMFLQSVVDRVTDRKALFARARVADRRIVPFLDFPYHDYMRVLLAAAETISPSQPTTVALRRFHQSFYETFAESLAGRVMFGVMGREAGRILPIGAKGWQVNVKLGSVSAVTVAPRHVRYTFADYPALVAECCDVGVIEGALRFFGEHRGEVRIRTPSPDHSEIDITW